LAERDQRDLLTKRERSKLSGIVAPVVVELAGKRNGGNSHKKILPLPRRKKTGIGKSLRRERGVHNSLVTQSERQECYKGNL